MSEGKIKEIILDLYIDNSKVNSTTTADIINGYLEEILIEKDSPSQINLQILRENVMEPIFSKFIQFSQENYFIEIQPSDSKGNFWTFKASKLPLNDKLVIKVSGAADSKIKIKIRYS